MSMTPKFGINEKITPSNFLKNTEKIVEIIKNTILYLLSFLVIKEEGLKFTRKGKLLFLLSLNGYSLKRAAEITGFNNKRRLAKYCSRRLFKCLRKMLDITEDKLISWQSIKTIIKNDNYY